MISSFNLVRDPMLVTAIQTDTWPLLACGEPELNKILDNNAFTLPPFGEMH